MYYEILKTDLLINLVNCKNTLFFAKYMPFFLVRNGAKSHKFLNFLGFISEFSDRFLFFSSFGNVKRFAEIISLGFPTGPFVILKMMC